MTNFKPNYEIKRYYTKKKILTLIFFIVSWRNCVLFLILIWKHWTESTIFPIFWFWTLFLDISWFQNTTHLHTKQNILMSESELRFQKWIVMYVKQNHNKRNNMKFNARNLFQWTYFDMENVEVRLFKLIM